MKRLGLWAVALVLAAAAAAVGLRLSASSPLYPPLTHRLVGAVNDQLALERVPPGSHIGVFHIVSATVPAGQNSTARRSVREVIRDCNEGRGTSVVAVGTVRRSFEKETMWAVFVDPPGKHVAPSSQAGGRTTILNWYVGFVRSPTQPFCDFGSSRRLPPVPVHGT